MFWNEKEGTKGADFPHKYAHITTPELWKHSINEAMRQRKDANGVAILTRPSRVFVVDADVSSKDNKEPGIKLWNRLVKEYGEPQTLKAQTGSGGLHFYLKANSPGLKCTRNFETIKVDDNVYRIDGRAGGGVVMLTPQATSRNRESLQHPNGSTGLQASMRARICLLGSQSFSTTTFNRLQRTRLRPQNTKHARKTQMPHHVLFRTQHRCHQHLLEMCKTRRPCPDWKARSERSRGCCVIKCKTTPARLTVLEKGPL
jgi:hypothetical protein